MDYLTVREAARKWGVSERLTQQYCTDGRIAGARKFGGAWAIPEDAEKPVDPRKRPEEPVAKAASGQKGAAGSGYLTPMPLMNAKFKPGKALEYVEGLQDVRLRDIALAEYHYFSGRPEEAVQESEPYLSHPDLSLRLSACLIYAYANLSIGQIQLTQRALKEVRRTLEAAEEARPPQLRAAAIFVMTTAAVLLHLPLPETGGGLQGQLHLLPPGLRMFALYVQAHQAYLQGDYGRSIGIVETAFAVQPETYPIPAIYLHLVAVMDYMSLKQLDRAQEHLLSAWELARPDDLIEGLGEHHGLLGGMLEVVLKKEWPEDFKRIIAITYRFSAGWRRIHNPETGEEVADNLTTTEFAAAMLAARNWTNQEIADHMGISPNTVKQYISTALKKLHIKQRKDLKQYMLR